MNKSSFIRSTAIAGALLIGLNIQASADDVYKSVDENGKITYSDAPTGTKVEPVDLPHLNMTPSVTPTPYIAPAPKPASTQYRVSITSPANGTEILAGQRDLTIAADVSPALAEGYSAQLYMNNSPYGGAQPTTSFLVANINRGEHQLSVAVLNQSGKIVAWSNNVTIYVIRPSVVKSAR